MSTALLVCGLMLALGGFVQGTVGFGLSTGASFSAATVMVVVGVLLVPVESVTVTLMDRAVVFGALAVGSPDVQNSI